MIRRDDGRATPALFAALLLFVVFAACGRGEEDSAAAAAEEEAEVVLPNPFVDLRPKAGDVLVPPQIGFRWRWVETGAGMSADAAGTGDAAGLAHGEFSARGETPEGRPGPDMEGDSSPPGDQGDGASGGEANGTDAVPGLREDGTVASGAAAGADVEPDPGATGGPDFASRVGEGDSEGADADGEHPLSELERTDAYPEEPTPTVIRAAGPRLFRVVMVDSIGAIYARTVTSASSIRVLLPPHTEPGPYRWHVEELAFSDSSVIARSAAETFEIR